MSKWCWQESDENLAIIHRAKVGDIVTLDGKQYVLEKKTTSACAIRRYWWWDRLYDKYLRKPDEI